MAQTDGVVIGIDSSTQSTKAIAFDRDGRAVAEGRAPIALSNPRLDRFEQEPEDWWASLCAALEGCLGGLAGRRIDGMAISNQRETMAFLDAAGRSVRPAMIWLDERARDEVRSLSARLGTETIHRITGRHPDLTPCVYRLPWMAAHEPDEMARTARFVDVQCYLVNRLTAVPEGPYRTGWTSADPMGMFDLEAKAWSEPILAAIGVGAERLPEALPPGAMLGEVSDAAAAATGLPAGLPVFAAGGDGQCAGLGTVCTSPGRAYINLGTAVVSGSWSPDYHYGRAWRTEIAAQGEGYIFENCLRSGAFLINWFIDRFVAGGKAGEDTFRDLEAAALELPIGSEGVMVQPYWSGVMDPHWDIDARGVILGLSGGHRPAHVYRAIIEGITLNQVLSTREMEKVRGSEVDHFVAIGGGAASALWRQMLADASGKQVLISDTVEASALGAAMTAAAGAGWRPSIVAAAEAMGGHTRVVEPDMKAHRRYGELLDIYRDIYAANAAINTRLVDFARKGHS